MTSSTDEKIVVFIDEDLEDLIPGFLENRRNDIQTMTVSLDQSDFSTIQSIGHSMKGAGGGYGFDAITDIGRALEESAKEQKADIVKKYIDELASYLDRIAIIYEEE